MKELEKRLSDAEGMGPEYAESVRRFRELRDMKETLKKGESVSEWDLLIFVYGRELIDRDRRGNSGRIQAMRKRIKRDIPEIIKFNGNNGQLFYSLPK